MIDSDDKILDRGTADATEPNKDSQVEVRPSEPRKTDSIVGELVAVSLKAVAVALSVVALILSILTVAMPLSAMRVFNKLGLKERALCSGERYIARRIDGYDGEITDERGNFTVLAGNPELCDDDMVEAINVCVTLSESLMNRFAAEGDEKSTVHFAKKLEEHTRQYASLYGVGLINADRNSAAIASVPSLALRPFVYDYAHTNMVLNYRARTYLGETDYALEERSSGDNVTRIIDLANLGGIVPPLNLGNIDRYVDYIGELGAYLDVKLTQVGAVGTPNETFVKDNLRGVLDGTELELLVNRTDGYTPLCRMLLNSNSTFTQYAQAAVDYQPQTIDEMLHQLFWLREFSTVSTRLYYLGMLVYYNQTAFGQRADDVATEYDALHMTKFVQYNGMQRQLSEVYEAKLGVYIDIYA